TDRLAVIRRHRLTIVDDKKTDLARVHIVETLAGLSLDVARVIPAGLLLGEILNTLLLSAHLRLESGELLSLLHKNLQRRGKHNDSEHENDERHNRETRQTDAAQPARALRLLRQAHWHLAT